MEEFLDGRIHGIVRTKRRMLRKEKEVGNGKNYGVSKASTLVSASRSVQNTHARLMHVVKYKHQVRGKVI
jgi:hypothetical protein